MSLIIDIGANVGTFAKFYQGLYPNAQIVCVEPNPDLIPILHGLFKGNDKIKIIDRLAASENGKLVDFTLNENHTLSTASKEWKQHSRFKSGYYKTIGVKTVTLDAIIKDCGEPNLIKIDVEGFELEVLRGLTKHPDCKIIFEWTEELFYRTVQCIQYLMTLGYSEFGYTMGDNYAEEPKEYTEFNEMKIFTHINLIGNTAWGNIFAR